MALYNKSILLIATLIVFATLQPSTATRGVSQPLKTRPQFFIPLFPCVPGIPRRLLPCNDPTPLEEPTECWSPLMALVPPCAEYLTNASVSSPPETCCSSYMNVVGEVGICLCHIGNGDIGKLLSAPLNFTQLFAIPKACGSSIRLQRFSHCNMAEVPPMTPPPSTPTGTAPPPAP